METKFFIIIYHIPLFGFMVEFVDHQILNLLNVTVYFFVFFLTFLYLIGLIIKNIFYYLNYSLQKN